MLLTNPTGTRFTLDVLDYQYPDRTVDEYGYDINWLKVKVDVETSEKSWSLTDPSLLSWELAQLSDWFASLAQGDLKQPHPVFIEPVLRFLLAETETGTKLRVILAYEALPPGADRYSELHLDFDLDPHLLQHAAAGLRTLVERFPERVSLTH